MRIATQRASGEPVLEEDHGYEPQSVGHTFRLGDDRDVHSRAIDGNVGVRVASRPASPSPWSLTRQTLFIDVIEALNPSVSTSSSFGATRKDRGLERRSREKVHCSAENLCRQRYLAMTLPRVPHQEVFARGVATR